MIFPRLQESLQTRFAKSCNLPVIAICCVPRQFVELFFMQIRRYLVGRRVQPVNTGFCRACCSSSFLKSSSRSSSMLRGQRACLGCCYGESIDGIETGAAQVARRETGSICIGSSFAKIFSHAIDRNDASDFFFYHCLSSFRKRSDTLEL